MSVKQITRYSILLALAVILNWVEHLIPIASIPGVRLGLANAIGILCLYYLGYSAYTGYYYTEARRQAMNKVIYELVENYDLGLIDFATTQNATNYTQYLGDSLHPSDKGMEAYSATAINAINEYFGKN
jgi:lysophospholipase L1-like esterase